MRKATYIEPNRVFVFIRKELDGGVQLWVRNTTYIECQHVAKGLRDLGIIQHAQWRKQRDRVVRVKHYQHFWDITLIGLHEDYQDDKMLKIAVQSLYRQLQETEVEWVSAQRFLNMKVWYRKEG